MGRGSFDELLGAWRELAALPPESNPYADEAVFRVIELRQYRQVPPADQKAHLERIAEELRNYADAREGKWREEALQCLA